MRGGTMNTIKGRVMVDGHGEGIALVTRMPMNFTAGFTKGGNILPGMRSAFMDRHHELFKQKIKNRVLVFPACIGSTGAGGVLLELMYGGEAPAAMIIQRADSLLVAGAVLGGVWFDRVLPVVEYASDDIYQKIRTGDRVIVDGSTGEIRIE
jgi:predicted aconitase with swiveling domain